MLLLALGALVLARVGVAEPVQGLAERLFAPLESGVHAVAAPVADFVTNVGNYGAIRDENRNLRAENERLSSDVSQLREEQAQAAQLNELGHSAQLFPNADFALANVIARDPSNVHDSVQIDKGKNDGIAAGMVVVGKSGALVGTVTNALATSAWIRQLTDPASDVNAEVQEARTMAIVSGSLGQRLSLQFVAEGTDVKSGDTVVTSGLGGNYPKGLLVGRVSKVEGAPLDLFKKIRVEPAVRPGTLESVLIMTSFVPARGDTGR